MASVVGSLVVHLSAQTAAFESGLKRSGAAAKQFSREALANEIFKTNRGSSQIARVADDAQDAVPRISNVRKLLDSIAKTSVGGRSFKMLGNIGGAASEMTGLSSAALGIGAGLAGGLLVAKQFGDTIRNARIEAAKLGMTYEEFAKKEGMIQFSQGGTSGLEAVSAAFENAWYAAKKITGEILGWISDVAIVKPAGFINSLATGDWSPVDFGAQGKLDARAMKESQYSQRFGAAEETLRGIISRWESDLENFGKSQIDVAFAKDSAAINKLAAQFPALSMGVADLTERWKQLTEREKQLTAATRLGKVGEAFSDTIKSLAKIGQDLKPEEEVFERFKESLAGLGINGDAAAPILAGVEAAKKLATARREQAEATKKAAEEEKQLRDRLKSMTETPITKFAAQADDLAKGLAKGFISRGQYDSAIKKSQESAVSSLMADLKQSSGASPMLAFGSRELFNAVADRSQGPTAELEEARRQTRLITQVRDRLPALPAVKEGAI
ncbi:MAG: hypothetical protein LLG00_05020 [Planctomycetaceae bacterium]|nr:hypothetical protein [Planctomycetaceae bacterium]